MAVLFSYIFILVFSAAPPPRAITLLDRKEEQGGMRSGDQIHEIKIITSRVGLTWQAKYDDTQFTNAQKHVLYAHKKIQIIFYEIIYAQINTERLYSDSQMHTRQLFHLKYIFIHDKRWNIMY